MQEFSCVGIGIEICSGGQHLNELRTAHLSPGPEGAVRIAVYPAVAVGVAVAGRKPDLLLRPMALGVRKVIWIFREGTGGEDYRRQCQGRDQGEAQRSF